MAIQSTRLSPYQQQMNVIAEKYKQRGYKVTIEPAAERLPDFLREFRPDLIAEGPDESVVVEIKARGKVRRLDDWARLASTVQQHPGWRLELVVAGDAQQNLEAAPAPTSEIIARLDEGAFLAKRKMFDAALLITWSALEAAMRHVALTLDISLQDFRPAALITALYTEGRMEREDYDLLMRCMDVRNQIAHGLQSSGVDSSCIDDIRHLTLRLLSEEVNHRSA
jgi:hypothetical protein